MFADNPFAGIAAGVPRAVMQGFVLLMAALVLGGTLFDMWHKGSARYFFENRRAAQKTRTREILAGETLSIGIRSVILDGLASGEFCSARRRLAHLLTMYGFLAVRRHHGRRMVFAYPDAGNAGARNRARRCGYRALRWSASAATGSGSCSASTSWRKASRPSRWFALTSLFCRCSRTRRSRWSGSWLQAPGKRRGQTFVSVFICSSTRVLFGSVPWSKFAHMFYKPAAAFQKRIEHANGSRSNLSASGRPARRRSEAPVGQPHNY